MIGNGVAACIAARSRGSVALALVALTLTVPTASATTVVYEAEGSHSFSWSVVLQATAVVSGANSLEIRLPTPLSAVMQNYDQTSSWDASASPGGYTLDSGSYWVRAIWPLAGAGPDTCTLSVTCSGFTSVSFPSWWPENLNWYLETDPWMPSTASAPVNTVTNNAATTILFHSGYTADRELDLEGVGSYMTGVYYSDDSEYQDGASVISRGSGNSGGQANALNSIAKSMGIPSGVVSAVQFDGTFNAGCVVSTGSVGLHGNAVAWDGVDQQWMMIDPQVGGTTTTAASVALAFAPEAAWVAPFAQVWGLGAETIDAFQAGVVSPFHSGVAPLGCVGSRDACGYSGCADEINGKESMGEIATGAGEPVSNSDPAAAEPGASGVGQTQLCALHLSRPNPMERVSRIPFTVGWPAHVTLTVRDVHGRTVRMLVRAWRDNGGYAAEWDRRDDSGNVVSAGVYFLDLQARNSAALGRDRAKLVVH